MTPKLIDVHTHTHFAAFSADKDAVIKRALEAEMWIINVGTQKDTSQDAVDTAHRYEGVFATVGLHPIHSEKSYHDAKELGSEEEGKGFISRGEDFERKFYKKLAEDPKVVALGECGLDYYRLTEETKAKQAEIFKDHIELSVEINKPLMIHCRNAFPDLIAVLEAHKSLLKEQPGICHFFTGSVEDAKKLLDLGFSFSFGGVITFAKEYEKLIKFIPLENIVLETDAPYVAPQLYRGKRNEPLYVEEVAKKIGRILGKEYDDIARRTTENAIRIFKLR